MEENKCHHCSKSFLFENTLNLHLRNVHEGGGIETNTETPVKHAEKASTSSSYKKAYDKNRTNSGIHRKSQTSASLRIQKCDKCSFKSSDSELYWAHVVLEHPQKPTAVFYCGFSHCWFPFPTLKLKEAHEITVHGSLHLPFKCILCKKNLANKSALDTHKNKCIRKPFYKCPCSPCDFQSNRFIQLSKHVEKSHQQDLLLVDKARYTFHHPEWEKSSDCDLTTESEGIKSEEEVVPAHCKVETLGNNVNPDSKGIDFGECLKKEDIKSDEEEEIVLSGAPETGPVPAPAPPFHCPHDAKTFPSLQLLHRHLHSAHLETGTDMVDCPLGVDSLACICGRTTNCRDTLVVHSLRCVANMGAGVESGNKKDEEDHEESREKGWIVSKRRARRKCRELGLADSETLRKTKMGMLEMCRKVSARKLDMTGKKAHENREDVLSRDTPLVVISDEDSNTDTEEIHLKLSPPPLAPAKRKSAISSKKSKASKKSPKKSETKTLKLSSNEDLSESELESFIPRQIKVMCPICEKIFDKDVVMEHFCEYKLSEKEVFDISSGSEIELSEEEDSLATTIREAFSEDETPRKTNTDMLCMLQNIRGSPNVKSSNSNVVTLSTSSFSFDLSYSLPSAPSTPSPISMSRKGGKRTRAKLGSHGGGRNGYAVAKEKYGLEFKK